MEDGGAFPSRGAATLIGTDGFPEAHRARGLREALAATWLAGNGGATPHPLYGLDMPDDFYEGLLDAGGLLRSCTLAGTKVFVAGGEGRLSAADLIEWIVAHHEGIERDDLPRLLANDLGITCPAPLLTTTIYNSDVYYDDIGDAYYSSMEAWKKEARNELA